MEFELTLEGLYPAKSSLELIQKWDHTDFIGLMEYIKPYFEMHGRFKQGRKYYYLSTGGWSGCEDIIRAINYNYLIWVFYWYSSRRGGHFKFQYTRQMEAKKNGRKRTNQKEEL